MLKDVNELFDMSPCCLVVVLIRLHEYPWVCLQIKLGQLCIIVQALAIVFKVEVGEETCVDMLTEVLTELEYHLMC